MLPILPITAPEEDAELAAAVAAWQRLRDRMTPERRNRALTLYDPAFARWQAHYDPLFRALVSLRRELASPYKDVPSEPLRLSAPSADSALKSP